MRGHHEEDYGEMVEIDVLRSSRSSDPNSHAYYGAEEYRGQAPPEPARPMRPFPSPVHPRPVHSDDYVPSPGWAPSPNAGARVSGHFLGDPQYYESRSSSPSLRSTGNMTPGNVSHLNLNAPRPVSSIMDSRPATPMNQSHLSLAALLPNAPPPMLDKEWVVPGSIARLHDRDDADIWKGWRRWIFKLSPFLTLANMGLYFLYVVFRITCIVLAQQKAGTTYAAAWIFVGIELATAVPPLLHNTWTMMSLKSRNRPKLRLLGEDVPTVDVFITCCKEDDDVVLDTVRAACDLDYPRDRFRVIVLDDGKVESLEKAVEQLAYTYPNLYYIARPKYPGVPHHFKAGNLNHGLDAVLKFPGGAGQFMAALDADMIPEKDWLRAVMPHLLLDDKMAMACPPQLFFNTPPSDPLAQSLDIFVHVIEPIKDAMGVAWCTGSGYVVRREALDQIGNFPLGSLAEDVATSTLLLGKGWKTSYVHEPLQFGTVPEDYGGHLKQRTRWAIGTVDTSFKLNFCLWGEKVRLMRPAQRFSGFLYSALSLYTILFTVSLFAIPVILIWGKPLVAYANESQLRWLVRACFAATISNRLCEFALFAPAGYHSGQRGSRGQLWMSPYIALCLIRSFVLPRWLGGQTQAFKPTGSLGSALNERDPKNRKNMVRRLWAILVNYMGLFHLAFVYATLVGAVLSTYRCFYVNDTAKGVLHCLVTHAFWPPVTFLFICTSMWTPIAYAIDPPDMPDREELLNRDPKTGVAHPTTKSKKIAFGGQAAWFELEYTASTLYTILIFVVSFMPYVF